MSCLFFGYSFFPATPPESAHFGAALIRCGGNRCALITDAHSPCWMEVGEGSNPDWAACPRNPAWITEAFRSEAEMARWNRHANYMDELRTQRVIVSARRDGGI